MRIEVRARCDVRTIRRVSVSFLKLANSKATDHCFCQGGSLSTNTSTYEEVRQGSQVVSRSTWKDGHTVRGIFYVASTDDASIFGEKGGANSVNRGGLGREEKNEMVSQR